MRSNREKQFFFSLVSYLYFSERREMKKTFGSVDTQL